MDREKAAMINQDFEELSKKHKLKASFGYFIDGSSNAMFAFNDISDNDMMHLMGNMIVRIAHKYDAPVKEILGTLEEGIKDILEKEQIN